MGTLLSILGLPTNTFSRKQPIDATIPFQDSGSILFNAQTISKGQAVARLERKPVSFDSFKVRRGDGASLSLTSFLKTTETDGLILLHHGKIAFEHYDHGYGEDVVHPLISLTKSVVGLLSGILVDQGIVTVNNSASFYVPELIGTSFEKIAVRECLDLRSGVSHDNADLEYRKGAGVIPLQKGEAPTDLHKYLSTFQSPSRFGIDSPVGAPFDYLSINADVVGWILERASGRPLAKLVSEHIWQSMGAGGDACIAVDAGGNARAAGGMHATLRDTARLVQLLISGCYDVIPSTWVHDIVRGGSQRAFSDRCWQKGLARTFRSVAYRSFWLSDADRETLMAMGIHGQLMIVDCKNSIVMVKFSSQPSRVDAAKKELALAAFMEF